jgi:phage terminase large subunit
VTLPVAQHVARRGRRRRELVSPAAVLAERLRARAAKARAVSSRGWRDDPVGFFRQILGVEPWSKQVEIIEAVRDHPRVSVASGHKVSKSHTAAGIGLWYYSSFEDARVVMSSTTARQVDQILWRELKMLRARGGRCSSCKREDPDGLRIARPCPHSALISGEIGELARTGLKSDDFREVVGFTAKEAEAVAGISGRNLLYIIDEASGVPDEIFEAIEGNRAGGARIVLFSNPTRTTGEFFESFHKKADFYKTIRVSSEETPNVTSGKVLIPGLATREWIDEKRAEWGEDSPLYKVRVRGEFALSEDGKIFSVHAITQAELRWPETEATGRLFVGIDPAGASGMGDESAFAVRRGMKLLALHTRRGLSEEAHVAEILGLISSHALPRETPVVVVDREGPIGSALFGRLRSHVEQHPGTADVVGMRSSDRAMRKPGIYDRARDELAANLEQWMRDGGAILSDVRLAEELHSLEWEQSVNGKLKVTRKTDLRKTLGRSPDRYDALALACWEPLSLASEDDLPASLPAAFRGQPTRGDDLDEPAVTGLDPYAGASAWGRR